MALAAAGLAALWACAGNVLLTGEAWRTVSALRSLVVDRDLDLFEEEGPLAIEPRPPGRERVAMVASSLVAPVFSLAHLASAVTGRWPPDGASALYGAALSLAALGAVVLGLSLTARMLAREGDGAVPAVLGPLTFVIASPLAAQLLRDPDPGEALAFLLSTMLLAARSARSPFHLRIAIATALVMITPCAVGWLVLLVLDLIDARSSPADEPPDSSPVGTPAMLFLIVAPHLAAQGARGGWHPAALLQLPGLAEYFDIYNFSNIIFSPTHPVTALAAAGLIVRGAREPRLRPVWLPVLIGTALAPAGHAHPATLAPVWMAGLSALASAATRRGLTIAALSVASLLACGNGALELARRSGIPAGNPGSALAWLAASPAQNLRHALLPADGLLPPGALADLLAVPRWTPAAAALGTALGAAWLAFRRAHSAPVLSYLGVTCAAGLMLVLVSTGSSRFVHRCTFRGGPAVLEHSSRLHSWFPPQGTLATVVEVALVTDRPAGVLAGGLLARVVIRDEHGRELEFPVIAGRLGTAHHTVSAPGGGRPAVEPARRQTCLLPDRWRVAEVRLERRHPVARLQVCGIWLGDPVGRATSWR